jgi:uncharacterized protein DUF6152
LVFPKHGSRAALAVAACIIVSPTYAHHSRAAFDTSVEVTIEGVVKNVVWANPHVYMTLEVAGSSGQPMTQEVEVGPLSTLRPLGLTQDVLANGDRVTVRANPNRAGPGHTVVGLDVTTSNGKVYPLHVFGRAQPAPAAQKATGLAGRWVPLTTGLQGLVQAAPTWPLTDVGRRGVADVKSQQASQSECSPWPAPLVMALPMMRTIDVTSNTLTMRFDWMNALRTVHLNLTEHPAGVAPSPQGHSIGRWVGESLVIDTVAFTPHREGTGFGIPSGASKHLIERLTLDADGTTLTYEFTVEDPLSLTEPVTRTLKWAYRPDLEPTNQQCDAEIATRFLRD